MENWNISLLCVIKLNLTCYLVLTEIQYCQIWKRKRMLWLIQTFFYLLLTLSAFIIYSFLKIHSIEMILLHWNFNLFRWWKWNEVHLVCTVLVIDDAGLLAQIQRYMLWALKSNPKLSQWYFDHVYLVLWNFPYSSKLRWFSNSEHFRTGMLIGASFVFVFIYDKLSQFIRTNVE